MQQCLFFVTVFLLSIMAHANLLQFAKSHFFHAETAPRVGIEIELTGITPDEIGSILQNHLGGELHWIERLEDNLDSKSGQIETYTVHELILEKSLLGGKLVIKPEDNVTVNTNMAEMKAKTRIYEIVTPPIRHHQVRPLDEALRELKKRGAEGTLEGHAVAIQINVEMGRGDRRQIQSKNILDILRNYLKPEHRRHIDAELRSASFRQMYLGMYTPGMMERILDTSYQPSNHQFFMDFMYRQSLEVLGVPDAWKMSDRRARRELKRALVGQPFDVLLPVVKWNYIRTSAVLMYLYPEEWISRYLLKTTWFHNYPIIEFREPNSDFRLMERVEQILGLVQYSVENGDLNAEKIKSPDFNRAPALRCSLLFAP